MGFRLAGMTGQHGTRRDFGIGKGNGRNTLPARHPFGGNEQVMCPGCRLSEDRTHCSAATSFA